jgi:adenosylcobinamide hydrolase
MKYYLRNATLFIRGTFRAASTGPQGGIGDVPTLLLCSVREQGKITDEQVMENRASGEGLSRAYFGLVSETGLQNLSILQYDYITVFILRGTPARPAKTEDSIHIIIYSGQGFSDAALLGAMITGTEAKNEALSKAGFSCSGSPGDRMVVASEGPVTHAGADPRTEAGKKIRECIRFGISRTPGETRPGNRPALYVFSRFGEEHFAEWTPEHCPYYPCHFEGQACDYCYCPFYPCGDEELGQYVTGSNGRMVWNCSRCGLLHRREIAEYFGRNPGASLKELKKREKSG